MKRVKDLIARLKTEYADKLSALNEDWSGGTGNLQFVAKGFHIAGTVQVQPSTVAIEPKVPLIVSLYGQKIKDIIEKEAYKVFL